MLQSALGRHGYALLTTFRRNGHAVATPIWFALGDADRAYFMTGPETGKAKRIRNNPHVVVAASSARGKVDGPSVDASVRRLQGSEAAIAEQALSRKYGLQWRVLGLLARLRRFGQPAFYELAETV